MKATVDATEFSQALNKVIKVVKRSQIPVLEGVLVQIKDGACTLTATDFTTWLTTAIPAQGDALAFVLQRPKDTARACGCFEGELALETEEKSSGKNRWLRLTMSCAPRIARMDAFLSEDYPAMRGGTGAAHLSRQRRPATGAGGARPVHAEETECHRNGAAYPCAVQRQ